VECFRRMLLASVIGIASEDSALAPVIGFLLCLVFLHTFAKRPFKEDDDSTLGIVLTYSLAFIFLGALLIKVNAHPNGDLERTIFDAVLTFLLLVGPGLIMVDALWSFLSKSIDRCKAQQPTTAYSKKLWMHRHRRRESLVKSLTSNKNTQMRGAGNAEISKVMEDSPHESHSGGMQAELSAHPTASLGVL